VELILKPACIVDASVVLAVLLAESSWREAAELLPMAGISTANLAEVATRLSRSGFEAGEIVDLLDTLSLHAIPLSRETAIAAGAMEAATKPLGLSLGDRICLELARERSLPVYTSDRKWSLLPDAATRDIRQIR
jgi:PIN domain nuclease of toxin-antitoxin system